MPGSRAGARPKKLKNVAAPPAPALQHCRNHTKPASVLLDELSGITPIKRRLGRRLENPAASSRPALMNCPALPVNMVTANSNRSTKQARFVGANQSNAKAAATEKQLRYVSEKLLQACLE
jgi:hypothetical protein